MGSNRRSSKIQTLLVTQWQELQLFQRRRKVAGQSKQTTSWVRTLSDETVPKLCHYGEKRNFLANVSTNLIKLNSRTNHMNNFYDICWCCSGKVLFWKFTLQKIYRSTGLPTKSCHLSQSSLVSVTVGEVIGMWDCSAVPHKDYVGCSYLVQRVISWGSVETRQENKFSFSRRSQHSSWSVPNYWCG